MATIPSLIVGPAIVAAGLAYKYSRFDDADQQDEGGAGFTGLHVKRMSEMTSSTTGYNGSGSGIVGRSMGARFEGDFQPRVPSERQRTDAFVPTNMVASSSSGRGGSGDGMGSLAQYQGDSKATADDWQQNGYHLEQQSGGRSRQDLYNSIPDRRVAQALEVRENPYPRTTQELENRSWLFRAMHTVSGDMGPIEHKDTDTERQRLVFPADTNREQISSTQGANTLKGTAVFSGGDEQQRLASDIQKPGDIVGQASPAADDVSRIGTNALDITGAEGSSGATKSGSWFWGSSSSNKDAARKAADESRGWFWSKKQDVDQAAQDAVGSAKDTLQSASDSVKEAADDTRGWFQSKKHEADQAASDAVGSVKDTLHSASDSVGQAIDDTRGWFSSKKSNADRAVSDTAGSASASMQAASGSVKEAVKEAADDTRGWFWNRKHEADRTASNAADSARDTLQSASNSVQEAADDSRGWFWNRKNEADRAVADATGAVESKIQTASDSVQEAAGNTRGWFWNKKQDAKSTVADTVDSAKDSLQSASDSVKDTAKESAEGSRDRFWNMKHDADKTVSDAARSAQDTMGGDMTAGPRNWLHSKKESAKGAMENEWEWVTGKVDDMGRHHPAGEAAATTSFVGNSVGRASNNASQQQPDSISPDRTAAQMSSATASMMDNNAQQTATTGNNLQQGGRRTRRDSMMDPLKGNSVLDMLDSKFDEARTALRNTSEELRTMANEAGSAASEKIKDAAETVRFHPTNEGIIREDAGGHDNGEAVHFVEIDSGIPQLSNFGGQTATGASVRRNR
ncbi:hypothetical protein EV175_005467 [Coemansia sp. RSA 1933]|nr:hypothetical protein EV175_005467 [Coemansia sp. RSA 1933]